MGWLFGTIALALLLCFMLGLILGLLWWLWRRSIEGAEYERRRLEAEAEADRLRLRVGSLKSAEDKAEKLQTELDQVRLTANRVPALEAALQSFKSRADLVPGLEQQVAGLRARADRAEQLESELALRRVEAARVGELEAEIVNLRADADRATTLETRLASLRHKADRVDGLQSEVEGLRVEAARVGDLERSISALNAELDESRKRADLVDGLQVELSEAKHDVGRIAGLEAEICSLRSELEVARADAGSERDRPEAEPEPAEAELQVPVKAGPAQDSWRTGTTELGTPGADHRDDLKRIHGIGPVMEKTLNSFGIQTWEQVAAFTPDDVAKVAEAIRAFPGRIERDDWIGGAQRLLARGHTPGQDTTGAEAEPEETGAEQGRAPSWVNGTTRLGTPGAAHKDDLKVVKGIGPVMEKTLNSFGIQSWEQLAVLEQADVEKVGKAIQAFPGRIDRDRWVPQAKDLIIRYPLRTPYDRPTRETYQNRG